MTNATPKILRVLSGETITPAPIWMMRQAGRHLAEYKAVRASTAGFIDFCFTPEKAARVTLQPIERYDMDAAILFADILLIPIGLGRDVRFEKGVGPILDPMSVDDVKRLTIDGAAERISSVWETVSRVRGELSDDKALIGFCGGAWTVATYMLEGRGTPDKEVAKRFAYEHPQAMDDLLNAIAVSSADYLIGQAKAGADALKIFESWAQGLSAPLFDKLVVKPTQIMINRVRDAGIDIPIIGFPRAAGLNLTHYCDTIKTQGVAAGTDTPLTELRKYVGQDRAIQGNLDPLALRIGGDVLRRAVQAVLNDAKRAGGPYIFNLGHGVSPDVKIDNVHAVINHLRTGEGDYV
ncbi:uroporphyrinogen decarboxylase [Fretibacter rubidus]|uniref:uroporphyrinogen decarboxylase n=1 Tax=Fretibacter rubidus TaxID=570162 RepID=UPI00352BCCBD